MSKKRKQIPIKISTGRREETVGYYEVRYDKFGGVWGREFSYRRYVCYVGGEHVGTATHKQDIARIVAFALYDSQIQQTINRLVY